MTGLNAHKFSGFPQGALRFLANLKRHNNREWFQKHKHVYEEQIRQPMEALIDALAVDFQKIAPEMVANRRASLYRIYRDTRFSKDKTPYKTHAAAVFPPKGLAKHEGAGFYFHFNTTEVLIGGGLYIPMPEDLMAVREHIAGNLEDFEAVLRNRAFRRVFGKLSGEQLTRTPRGFPADHPAEPYLRHKQFLAMTTLPPEVIATPRFYPALLDAFRALNPFIQFLNEPILKSRKLKQRQEALLGRA